MVGNRVMNVIIKVMFLLLMPIVMALAHVNQQQLNAAKKEKAHQQE